MKTSRFSVDGSILSADVDNSISAIYNTAIEIALLSIKKRLSQSKGSQLEPHKFGTSAVQIMNAYSLNGEFEWSAVGFHLRIS